MTIHDLLDWGVIRKATVDGDRRRHFEANTDIWAMVTRVFKRRELTLVDQVMANLEEALRLVKLEPDTGDHMFLIDRIESLLRLTKAGRKVIAQMAKAGKLDINSLKGTLLRRVT